MDADLDTLATALYAKIDDALKDDPGLGRWRPEVGIEAKLADAKLCTLAVLQALLGFTSEARWLRHARAHLAHLFPYLPGQSGCNKRLRAAAAQLNALIRILAADTAAFFDDVWLIDSTPVECGRSRPTAKRSDLAGYAGYGYCASHSAGSGGCACTWCARPPASPSRSRSPTRRSTSARWPATDSRSTTRSSERGAVRSSWPTRATPAPSSRRS